MCVILQNTTVHVPGALHTCAQPVPRAYPWKAMDSCFALVRPHQQGIGKNCRKNDTEKAALIHCPISLTLIRLKVFFRPCWRRIQRALEVLEIKFVLDRLKINRNMNGASATVRLSWSSEPVTHAHRSGGVIKSRSHVVKSC